VVVDGIAEEDRVILTSVGYINQDISLLFPLWAGVPARERATLLVEHTVTNPNRFWRLYGIPACAEEHQLPEAESCQSVHVAWNAMVGEGLLAYGYRTQAAELVTRLMAAIVRSLKQENAFRKYYHAGTGQGIGEWNDLNGLAPLGLFLDTLGVRLISPRQVALTGFNPYPWPVTVKYRGLTVLRQPEKTTVIFPDGQAVSVDDPSPCLVTLE